jgi:NDP-4-keto-2,6-dideoxyhexose 3-C-methyltransferase
MSQEVQIRTTCRACPGRLREILNLGSLRLNTFPQYAYQVAEVPQVPLVLMVCETCGLIQLDRTVPPDWLYREYWYRSGVNESMVAELQSVVVEALGLVTLEPGEYVLDIGANDGTLLSNYATFPVKRFAVEPALNMTDALREHADLITHDYFPSEGLIREYPGRFKVITAIACAYDTEEPYAFFQGICDLLAPGGIAVVQFQDFEQQARCAAFDNICHEHLLYYTLWSLTGILFQTGLRLVRVTPTPINGGSLRCVLQRRMDPDLRQDPADTQSVVAQRDREHAAGLSPDRIQDGVALQAFAQRVQTVKTQITTLLWQTLLDGKVIDVYGASTKGNVLLQVLEIGALHVRQAIDRSPAKWGRFTLTGIPIVSEEAARGDPADVWLCPIWQFRDFMLAREAWYLKQGGAVIFPLPYCEVVRASWWQYAGEDERR